MSVHERPYSARLLGVTVVDLVFPISSRRRRFYQRTASRRQTGQGATLHVPKYVDRSIKPKKRRLFNRCLPPPFEKYKMLVQMALLGDMRAIGRLARYTIWLLNDARGLFVEVRVFGCSRRSFNG